MNGDGRWLSLGGLNLDFVGRGRGRMVIFESVGDSCGGGEGEIARGFHGEKRDKEERKRVE